jgi:hypothetical protein
MFLLQPALLPFSHASPFLPLPAPVRNVSLTSIFGAVCSALHATCLARLVHMQLFISTATFQQTISGAGIVAALMGMRLILDSHLSGVTSFL